ncbi:MAG: MFS transporter [Clostridia bacterium]|nr:MFS transporter [Clostridia bacterium]
MKRQLSVCALTELRDGRRLFLLCFVVYCSVYIGRLNLAAVITEITTTGILEKDSAGLISTAFFVVYAAGQLVNGFVSDRMSPFFLIASSLGLSAAANLVMFFAMYTGAPFWCYMLIWAANGVAQSAIYPTLIRIISTVMPEQMQITAGANLFASTAVGTMTSNLLCSAIMKYWSWQFCFLVPALWLGLVAMCWIVFSRFFSAKCVSRVEYTPNSRESGKASVKPKHDLIGPMVMSGAFVMMISIGAFSIVKESITVWSPTLLTEIFSAEPSFTVAISTVIPLAAIFGAMIARFILMNWLHDEMKSISFLYVLVGIGLVLVLTAGMHSIWTMLVLLAVIIVLLTGINTLFMGIIPLRFGRYGIASTITGVLNSISAIGNGVAAYLTGLMAQSGGWNRTIVFWLVLVGVALLVSLLLIRRWMRFKQM